MFVFSYIEQVSNAEASFMFIFVLYTFFTNVINMALDHHCTHIMVRLIKYNNKTPYVGI